MTKNTILKQITLLAVCLFLGLTTRAQVKVGNNPTTINANSVLEMESANKGMLLPRLALSSTTSFAPLAAHVAGMTVYNTATAADVTPGFFYNDGSKWVRLVGAAVGSGAQNTTAGPLMTITNGAGATMTAMTVAVDTNAMKSFISQAVQNGAITGRNTTAGSLITVTNGAGATLAAMTVAVDTNALKTFIIGSTTNTLISSTNTMTNTTNGVASSAPIVNSNTTSLTGTNLTTTVNGVASAALNLYPIVQEPWFNAATSAAATSNTQNIYQTGSVRVGTGSVTGSFSLATGSGNTVSGANSLAVGTTNTVSGANSLAVGTSNNVQGSHSAIFGFNNTSTTASTLISGSSNRDSSQNNFLLGNSNQNNSTVSSFNILAGTSNIINTSSSGSSGNFINGTGNQMFQVGNSIVYGLNNRVGINTGYAPITGSLVMGNNDTIGTMQTLVMGSDNKITTAQYWEGENIIVGNKNSVNAASNLGMIGSSNYYTSIAHDEQASIVVGFGDSISTGYVHNVYSFGPRTRVNHNNNFIAIDGSGSVNQTLSTVVDNAFTTRFRGGYRFFTDASSTANQGIYFTPGGNVGIGTTTPTNKLHVTATSNPLRLEGLVNGSTSDSILTTNATGVVRKLGINDLLGAGGSDVTNDAWYMNGSSTVVLNGNVGIGTAAPGNKLTVSAVNPLRLDSLQSGAIGDSLLSVASNGVVRKVERYQIGYQLHTNTGALPNVSTYIVDSADATTGAAFAGINIPRAGLWELEWNVAVAPVNPASTGAFFEYDWKTSATPGISGTRETAIVDYSLAGYAYVRGSRIISVTAPTTLYFVITQYTSYGVSTKIKSSTGGCPNCRYLNATLIGL